MSVSTEVHARIAHHKGAVAGLTRSRPSNDPQLTDHRRALAAAKLEKYVSEVVAAAPPLTADQSSKIAALLRPAAGRDAA